MRRRPSAVTPVDIEEAAKKIAKEHTVPEKESTTWKYDHGPLRTWEVTWMDGTKETVQGHSVMFDQLLAFDNRRGQPRFSVHGEFDGHWRLVLSGRADDVRSVRDVTPKPSQAVLPEELRTPLIGNMKVGQIGYAVPWAMVADKKENLWLGTDYQVAPSPQGTMRMRVELREDGYHVWPAPGETYAPSYPWQPKLLPVAAVETGKEKDA